MEREAGESGPVVTMDAKEAARIWARTWSRAWPAKDADAIAELYADGSVYRSHPFRSPRTGPGGAREYAVSVFAEEQDVQCWFGEPIVHGSRAAVEWWAVYRDKGVDRTLAGTSILVFAADGRVAAHCDYWVEGEGRRLPPPGWGT